MSLSKTLYTGDGVSTNYTVDFSFIRPEFVEVFVDSVKAIEGTDYTLTGSVVSFTSAPANGSDVLLKRATDATQRLVDFEGGSSLTEADLDLAAQQVFDIAQETKDDTADTIKTGNDGQFDAKGLRITNIADPVNGSDALNKNATDTFISQANAAVSTSTAAAAQSVASAGAAASSAGAASSSAASAAASASTTAQDVLDTQAAANASAASAAMSTAAQTAAEIAQAAAFTSEGSATDARDSASGYAGNAAASASAATASAASALSSEQNAASSEEAAGASASASAASAAAASTSAAAVDVPSPVGKNNHVFVSDGSKHEYIPYNALRDSLGIDIDPATQLDMEAAASFDVTVTPGAQHQHPGHPKAFVKYDVANDVILSSYNVLSVVHQTNQTYRITFETPFADGNYSWYGSCEDATAATFLTRRANGAATAEYIDVSTQAQTGASYTADVFSFTAIGSQVSTAVPIVEPDPVVVDGPFQEVGGILCLDVADAVTNPGPTHSWSLVNGEMVAGPEDGTSFTTPGDVNSPSFEWDVEYTTAGNWYVHFLVDAPGSSSDSLHYRMDGGAFMTSESALRDDDWNVAAGAGLGWANHDNSKDQLRLTVAAGEGKFLVYMREAGLKISKVVITSDGAYDPRVVNAGAGPATSLRSTVAPGAGGTGTGGGDGPAAPVSGTLVPGPGWTGATATPSGVGTGTQRAIAHWNIVPEQEIANGFQAGVIAHHLDGIDRVEIAANGGDFVSVTTPSLNPRTNCLEYWAALDLTSHTGPVTLRAIAYPTDGLPYVVKPLGSLYSEGDLTLYTSTVGEVVPLPAGVHTINTRSLPATGWLIYRPEAGVAKEDCIINSIGSNWSNGRLKFEGVTLELGAGNNVLRGQYQDVRIVGHHVWIDDCKIVGNGPLNTTSWITYMWETQSYTNCNISRTNRVFHGYRGIKSLVRNCVIDEIYEDVIGSGGLYVGLTLSNIDRDPVVIAQGIVNDADKPHPDVLQLSNLQDTILQGVTGTLNVEAQGIFPGDVTNTAFVDVELDTVSPYRSFQVMGTVDNLLIKDSIFRGGQQFRGQVLAGSRLVVRDSEFGDVAPFLMGDYTKAGVETYVLGVLQ